MILVTGAGGQLGCDLVTQLAARHGAGNILATDLRIDPGSCIGQASVETAALDVTDANAFGATVRARNVDTIFHLAGILSARGEQNPEQCWRVNIQGLRHVLEIARENHTRIFWPSSIAVFGPDTPKNGTPQTTIANPSTMYGITKVTGEMLCEYYARRWDVDVRSVRYPGIISHGTPPGGGTTDWAVAMFFDAVKSGVYTSFVSEETRLPMMYMSDAVKAALDLMDAPAESISVRTSYNLTAFSFSAAELAAEIAARVPGFVCRYEPDFRQQIADSWPRIIDDSVARRDWGWQPEFEMVAMIDEMLAHVPASTE